MHKVYCWVQIIGFLLITSYAGVWLFAPRMFTTNVFAEPHISYDEYIERLVNGSTDWQRYNAASALGEIGNPSAIPHLIKALSDDSSSVRLNSLYALDKLKAVNSIEYIKPLLSDPADDVRQSAEYVIKQLEKVDANPKKSYFWDYFLISIPAILITLSLTIKLAVYSKYKHSVAVRGVAILAWPVGLLLAWLAQRPYEISETQKAVGFPFRAAVFQYESGGWSDYLSELTLPLLTLDMVYALFCPQVILAAILGAMLLIRRATNNA